MVIIRGWQFIAHFPRGSLLSAFVIRGLAFFLGPLAREKKSVYKRIHRKKCVGDGYDNYQCSIDWPRLYGTFALERLGPGGQVFHSADQSHNAYCLWPGGGKSPVVCRKLGMEKRVDQLGATRKIARDWIDRHSHAELHACSDSKGGNCGR